MSADKIQASKNVDTHVEVIVSERPDKIQDVVSYLQSPLVHRHCQRILGIFLQVIFRILLM